MRRYSGALLHVDGQNQLLFEVRRGDDSSPGLWGFIGGGGEGNETPLDTMCREWREETGRDPQDVGFRHHRDLEIIGSRGDPLQYSVFEGTIKPDAELELSEAAGVVAVDIEELRAGVHDHQLTLVARTVLTQVLGEQQ